MAMQFILRCYSLVEDSTHVATAIDTHGCFRRVPNLNKANIDADVGRTLDVKRRARSKPSPLKPRPSDAVSLQQQLNLGFFCGGHRSLCCRHRQQPLLLLLQGRLRPFRGRGHVLLGRPLP